MDESSKRNWVWFSTEESRAAGQVSVWAVAETVFFIAVYWVLVLWLGVTWHHWMILIAAPMVLLRSDQSVAKGVAWFDTYASPSGKVKLTSFKGICILGLSAALAGGGSWFLATFWLGDSTGWALFVNATLICWLALNIGFTVAVALAGAVAGAATVAVAATVAATVAGVAATVAGAVAGAGAAAGAGAVAAAVAAAVALAGALAVAGSVVGPGFFIGIWLRAVGIRLTATLRFLPFGLQQMPQNWRFATSVSDLRHPPELVPGHAGSTWQGFSSLSLRKPNGEKRDLGNVVFELMTIPFFYVPTLIWRWSIKSTAWFYIPLLWVRRGWSRLEGEELRVWAQSYSHKAINWLWLIFGGLSFAALAVGLFSFEKWSALQQATSEAGAPMTFVGVVMSLNWAEVLMQPWMWFYIPSYVLTICIFFALNSIAAEIRADAPLEPRKAKMAHWKWAANARAVLTNIGLAVALWYFLDAVGALDQVRDFFTRIF